MSHILKFDWLDGRRIVFSPAAARSQPRPSETGISREGVWRRVLYEKQSGFPDNYVPPSFLARLGPGAGTAGEMMKFGEAAQWTAAIVQHVSLVVLFILTWQGLLWWHMPVEALISLDVVLMTLGYLARHRLLQDARTESPSTLPTAAADASVDESGEGQMRNNKSKYAGSVYVFGTLWILSPVLKTLTMAWAEDSIYAMAVILMLVHGVLHDYGFVYREPRRGASDLIDKLWKEVDNPLALNAAMFAAIILASRLETVTHVFAFEFFAITCFMLLPPASKLVFRFNPYVYTVYLTITVFSLTSYALYTLAPFQMLLLYVLGMLLIGAVAPWLYLRLQGLRIQLKGPWDIVHIKRKKRNSLKHQGEFAPHSPLTPSQFQ